MKIETHSGEFVTNNTEKSDRRTILRHAERSCQTSQIQRCNKTKKTLEKTPKMIISYKLKSEPFQKEVDNELFPHYDSFVLHPMDISLMEKVLNIFL